MALTTYFVTPAEHRQTEFTVSTIQVDEIDLFHYAAFSFTVSREE